MKKNILLFTLFVSLSFYLVSATTNADVAQGRQEHGYMKQRSHNWHENQVAQHRGTHTAHAPVHAIKHAG